MGVYDTILFDDAIPCCVCGAPIEEVQTKHLDRFGFGMYGIGSRLEFYWNDVIELPLYCCGWIPDSAFMAVGHGVILSINRTYREAGAKVLTAMGEKAGPPEAEKVELPCSLYQFGVFVRLAPPNYIREGVDAYWWDFAKRLGCRHPGSDHWRAFWPCLEKLVQEYLNFSPRFCEADILDLCKLLTTFGSLVHYHKLAQICGPDDPVAAALRRSFENLIGFLYDQIIGGRSRVIFDREHPYWGLGGHTLVDILKTFPSPDADALLRYLSAPLDISGLPEISSTAEERQEAITGMVAEGMKLLEDYPNFEDAFEVLNLEELIGDGDSEIPTEGDTAEVRPFTELTEGESRALFETETGKKPIVRGRLTKMYRMWKACKSGASAPGSPLPKNSD